MVNFKILKYSGYKSVFKKFIIFVFLLFYTFLFTGCKSGVKQNFTFKDSRIKYMGRIGETDSCKEIYWSGSSITVNFQGKNLSLLLKDEKGENYFNIIIDGKVKTILHTDSLKKMYRLTSDLENGIHTVTLFKRTEWTKGKTLFYGIQLDESAELLKINKNKKLIEFYGNSITAGYAVEDTSGKDSPEGTNTNCYNSYAAITARYFNADFNCIARSGIGITISWFPMIMDEMYYRLNPADKNSKWDFTKSTPNLVVINLLQNDSWLVNRPEFEEFKNRFGKKAPSKEFIINAYKNFVKKIRDKYPDTKIICMLGNMDITKKGSPWPGYVKSAASKLNDKNIYTLFVPYKNTKGHPNIKEQNILADSLIGYIKYNFNWKTD